jgi:hypothetical protein
MRSRDFNYQARCENKVFGGTKEEILILIVGSCDPVQETW